MLRSLLTRLFVIPLLKDKMAFEIGQMTFVQILLRDVGLFAHFAAVEHLAINEHGFVFPLPRLLVFAAVIRGKAEARHLAAVGEGADLRLAGETTNQDDFVDVCHRTISNMYEGRLTSCKSWIRWTV